MAFAAVNNNSTGNDLTISETSISLRCERLIHISSANCSCVYPLFFVKALFNSNSAYFSICLYAIGLDFDIPSSPYSIDYTKQNI